MPFSSTHQRQPREAAERPRNEQRLHPADIVVSRVGADSYAISTVAGRHIGICRDRIEAMRQACSAAREADATVWIRGDGASAGYGEVLCP